MALHWAASTGQLLVGRHHLEQAHSNPDECNGRPPLSLLSKCFRQLTAKKNAFITLRELLGSSTLCVGHGKLFSSKLFSSKFAQTANKDSKDKLFALEQLSCHRTSFASISSAHPKHSDCELAWESAWEWRWSGSALRSGHTFINLKNERTLKKCSFQADKIRKV